MGSHSARHRSARTRATAPEERATALVARLGPTPYTASTDTAQSRHAAMRRPIGRPDLDGSTALPVRPSRPPGSAGGTRGAGSRPPGRPLVNPVGVPLTHSFAGTPATADDAAVGRADIIAEPGSADLDGPADDAPATAGDRRRHAVDETAPWPVTPAATGGPRRAAHRAEETGPWPVTVPRAPAALFTPVTAPHPADVASSDGARIEPATSDPDLSDVGTIVPSASPSPTLVAPWISTRRPADRTRNVPPTRRGGAHSSATTGAWSLGLRAQPMVAALSVTAVGAGAVLAATAISDHQQVPRLTATHAPVQDGALSLTLASAHPTARPHVADPRSVLTAAQPTVAASSIVARATADAQATTTPTPTPDAAATASAAARASAAVQTSSAARASAAAASSAAAKASVAARAAASAALTATATVAPAPVAAPSAAPPPASHVAPPPPPTAGSNLGVRALAAARTRTGRPYVWGAAGPGAFDCSGLVLWAFNQVGVSLPHSSAAQSTMGTPVARTDLQPGDLVFFYSPVRHVGIYAGNGMVLNAPAPGEDVQLSSMAYMPFHSARRMTT